jgi:hypothetical protein
LIDRHIADAQLLPVNSHMTLFAEALSLSDLFDPEVSTSGMNSAAPQSPGIVDGDASTKETEKDNGGKPQGGRQGLLRERQPSMASVQGWEKVEKVKALSDFAPIHTKVSKYVCFPFPVLRWKG